MSRHIRNGCRNKHNKGRAHAHARKIRARASALAARALPASHIAQAQDKGPIQIGFLPPITGPLASPGAEMVNGFRLFWEQAGMTAGGRKVEIVTGDTTCNPDQALTQARRLVLQEKVHFMVGPLCGHEGPAVAQVSKETGVPLVMDAAGADNVHQVGPHADGRAHRDLVEPDRSSVRRVSLQGTRPAQCALHRTGLHVRP
jgi:ABC-type branched-subunit amino acid transport system substrate-binding protein